MEAPPPEIIIISKTLKALKDKKQLSFEIKIKENKFFISTEIENSIIKKNYEGIFSLQEIQNNKYFLQFDSIKEIFEELIFKSQKEFPIIREENSNLILKIFLSSSKFKDVEFILKPKIKSIDDKYKELYTILTEIKNENFELKQKINNLKQENFKFKNQLNILIDSIKVKNKKNKKNELSQNSEDEDNENESIQSISDDDEEKSFNSSKGNYEEENLNTSTILNGGEEEINKFKKFIFPDRSFDSELKYRMTRDGNSFKVFHKLCDNVAPNLMLVKDDKENIFGGFTYVSWEDMDLKKKDTESFLFSVTKNKKYPAKNIYDHHVFCFSDLGPKFCSGNLGFPLLNMKICVSTKKGEYLDESLSTNKPGQYFIVQEVELYQILFN